MYRLERKSSSDELNKIQFDRMVESNTKLVDENRMYKNDIKVLIRYILI